MFNLFIQNKDISCNFCYRRVQKKLKGCTTYVWKSYFSLQCYTNIRSFFLFFFFFSLFFFSTSVAFFNWCKHLESQSSDSNDCSFSYFLLLSYAYKGFKQYTQKYSDVEIGFSCFSLRPPTTLPELN